jgi:sugar lactone lactonase YvrE
MPTILIGHGTYGKFYHNNVQFIKNLVDVQKCGRYSMRSKGTDSHFLGSAARRMLLNTNESFERRRSMQYRTCWGRIQSWFIASLLCMATVSSAANSSRAGTVYTSLFNNGTIVTINTSSPSTPSTFATGLSSPAGMAFDAAGDLFVSNTSNGTISEITPSGVVTTFASGLGEPEGLVFGSNGNLFVAGGTSNKIYEITPGGVVSTFASSNLDAPVGLAIDSSGNIYAANQFNGTIVKFTPGGSASTFASGLSTLDDLVFDSSGNLWVSDSNGFGSTSGTVLKFTPGGSSSTILTGLNNPANMAFDSAGNLFIANLGGTITELTPGGTVSTFASGLAGPNGIAIGVSALPEPASLTLFCTGALGMMLGCVWHRKWRVIQAKG